MATQTRLVVVESRDAWLGPAVLLLVFALVPVVRILPYTGAVSSDWANALLLALLAAIGVGAVGGAVHRVRHFGTLVAVVPLLLGAGLMAVGVLDSSVACLMGNGSGLESLRLHVTWIGVYPGPTAIVGANDCWTRVALLPVTVGCLLSLVVAKRE